MAYVCRESQARKTPAFHSHTDLPVRGQRFEQPILHSTGNRVDLLRQFLPLAGQKELAGAAARDPHFPIDESRFLQSLYHATDGRPVIGNQPGKLDLIKLRKGLNCMESRVLNGSDSERLRLLGENGESDLLQSADERSRHCIEIEFRCPSRRLEGLPGLMPGIRSV